ncbi:PKD-like family lipoprotein [Porphyromonas sp.]|uniref:PKD-like family lipoprotein n=1 Tax=Porphyromonas sp. TaxID=1924944 RepID=UPI0026DC161D|nr:PKD-like family lipoprotein [Porphyromonas sp.]MDO4771293.1 PKD-like family lipoprotein [Porphyromonas sp.]
MKKIISLSLLALLTTSCYKDLGNYEYDFDSLNEIKEVAFSPKTFIGVQGETVELQQPITEAITRRIEVTLTQSKYENLDNLDFTWFVSRTEGTETITDTLHTKGYLDVPLAAGKPSQYKVRLKIQDKVTSISKYVSLYVSTRPIYKNSLFVLHGGGVGSMKLGNIEELPTGVNIISDAFKHINPNDDKAPFSNSIGLGYSAYYNLRGRKEAHSLCAFKADGTADLYEPFGLTTKFHGNYVLPYQAEDPFVFSKIIATGDAASIKDYKCILSRDGRFYVARTFLCFYQPAGITPPDDTYKVTAATITGSHFVLWDAQKNRFLILRKDDAFPFDEKGARNVQLRNLIADAYVDFSSLGSALSPVGKSALYAYNSYRDNYSEAHPFFIFKDESNKFFIYELTPVGGGKDNDKDKGDGKGDGKGKDDNPSENAPQFTITGKPLRNLPADISTTTLTYNSWFSTNYIFYAKGGAVFRYNISNGDIEEMYVAPEGYKVSLIKFRTEDSGLFVADLGRILSIGLNKGSEGAVAEIKLTTSADIDHSFTPRFYDKDKDGVKFGNIKDLQFAHIYFYKS